MADQASALRALADRCVAATSASHHLDAQIFILLDPDAQHIVGSKPGPWPREPIYGPRSSFWEWALDKTKEPPMFAPIPAYTASLDAAMALVPEGCDWLVRNDGERGFANVTAKDFQSHITLIGPESYNTSIGFSAPIFAATPALALCAASLRARAAQGGEAGTAETENTGSVHEHPVGNADAP